MCGSLCENMCKYHILDLGDYQRICIKTQYPLPILKMLSLRNLIFYDSGTTQSMIPLTKTFQTHKITFSSTLDDLALKSGIFRNINMTASPSYLKKNHKV